MEGSDARGLSMERLNEGERVETTLDQVGRVIGWGCAVALFGSGCVLALASSYRLLMGW
jgi:hypothetical protein